MDSLIQAIPQQNMWLFWCSAATIIFTVFCSIPKLRHLRYSVRIVSLTVVGCFIITLYILNVIPVLTVYILSPFYMSLVYIAYRTIKKPVYPLTAIIKNSEKLLQEGDFSKLDKVLESDPWYIFYTSAKLEWNKLKARKLSLQDKHKEAYQIYIGLMKLNLFQEEKDEIKLKQVRTLLLLGDTSRAKSIFDQISDSEALKDRFEILSLQSSFDEKAGDFEKARQSLLGAIAKFDETNGVNLATIYNNLARMEAMLSNTTDVIHYYKKSARLAKDIKEKHLIHVVYPNLIDSLLLNNGDPSEATLYHDEYFSLIDPQNVDDLLKFNNYKLVFARQINDRAMLLKAIEEGRIQILPMIPFNEKLSFDISELRIRFSHQIGWGEKLFEVWHHFEDYSKLDFPEKYHAFKEILIILENLFRSNNLGPFRQMFEDILNYFERASAEIEDYILNLPDYCVYERCDWEKEKVFLRRVVKGLITPEMEFKNIQSRLGHLRNIKDIHAEHGNYIESTDADLNIVDEAMAAATNLENPDMKGQMRNIMQEHFQVAIEQIERFKLHPETNIQKLRAAKYALFLGDKELARKYFEDFKQSKFSIHHYFIWLQKYYNELASEFHDLQN